MVIGQDPNQLFTSSQGDILDLEMDYFNLLKKEFHTKSFTNSLYGIQHWIQSNYSNVNSWAPKNKLALPFQRLIAYQMFKHFNKTYKLS